MKKLLVVAYYFPPSGGPGVQRVLKHIKYLPDFGWQPIVLTVSNGQFPARDESLFAQIPDSTIVERTKIYEPYDIYRYFTGKAKDAAIDVNTIKKDGHRAGFKESLAEFIRATFFIPDARIGWLLTAKSKALELIKQHDISAVYSSSPPYTCSLIADYASKKASIPWIAGFRDPWTGFISSPKRWLIPSMIDRYMEKSVFTNANYVECAWNGIIKDALAKYPDLDASKFLHVPNGFDSNDFPDVQYKANHKFTLTYTGSMYGRRNPESLFAAIEELIAEGKIDKNKIVLRFVGRFGNEVNDMFEKATFADRIEIIGYVPHSESIAMIMKSDALLLVVDESKESKEIVPGKVYEYIGVNRPLIAIGPEDGSVAELIRETAAGDIAHQSNIAKIKDMYLDAFKNWKNGDNTTNSNLELITKYERRNATKQLAELLTRLV
ncbi:MAG: hypothetical protein M9949_14830 [Candidatus Kapabacteria bacterium]|nr:hypothetical protein [Candidatus Kapabacteria bacterium]